MTLKVPAVLKSWSTLIVAASAAGIVLALDRWATAQNHAGTAIGVVALGSGVAALGGGLVAAIFLLVSRRKWAIEDKERMKRAAIRLSDFDRQIDLQYASRTLERLLEVVVEDAARELAVDPESMNAQIMLLVGRGDGDGADRRERFLPQLPQLHSEDRARLISSARSAVAKNTPIAAFGARDQKTIASGITAHQPDWIVSVPIFTTHNAPSLGAITLSGTNGGGFSEPHSAESFQPVVSLMLGYARLAALLIGAPSFGSERSGGHHDED